MRPWKRQGDRQGSEETATRSQRESSDPRAAGSGIRAVHERYWMMCRSGIGGGSAGRKGAEMVRWRRRVVQDQGSGYLTVIVCRK
jgi:hypothetical protein